MKLALKYIKRTLLFIVYLVVFMEIGSWIYIRNFNQDIPLPTYSIVDANVKFWACIDENFGVWHDPNSSYLHNKSCFTVQYHANSMGMRDKERTYSAEAPRAVLMGDSFIEGWGNESEDRLSNLLEDQLDREVLNFATAGSFGTIQEWQQYKHLISKFDHDVVLLSILPKNDFDDNSYDYAVATKDTNRSPYLVGKYPEYELVYSHDSLPSRKRGPRWLMSFDFTLREWSCLYRLARYSGSYRIKDFELQPRWLEEAASGQSMYYDFNAADWDIMRYSIEQIMKEAKGKQVVIFTTPVHADFERYDGTPPPLAQKLQKMADELGFVYCDLLKEMAGNNIAAEDIFFVCDNHWSPSGNRIAAEILKPYVAQAFSRL